MRLQSEEISLVWPSGVLAGLVLAAMMIYWGTAFPVENDLPVPYVVRLLAMGARKMPETWYLMPAIIIGIGCGLSSQTVFSSVKSSLLGIVSIAAIVAGAMLWEMAANLSGQIDGDSNKAFGSGLALVVGMPGFFLLVVRPLLFGSLCAAILLHLVASFVSRDHRDWLVDESDVSAPPGQLLDVGVGVTILLFTTWYFFGSIISLTIAPPTPQDIVAELQPPLNGEILLATPNGRESTRLTVRKIYFEVEKTRADPCNWKQRSWLKTTVHNYFRRIRLIEDWKPGQQLSVFSREAADLTRQSLSAGYITWDEIEPYVRIHLGEESDAAASMAAREKLACS